MWLYASVSWMGTEVMQKAQKPQIHWNDFETLHHTYVLSWKFMPEYV